VGNWPSRGDFACIYAGVVEGYGVEMILALEMNDVCAFLAAGFSGGSRSAGIGFWVKKGGPLHESGTDPD